MSLPVPSRLVALAVGLALSTWPATAQELTLQLDEGRVSLVARGVSVAQVLDEWARLGGTTIVDADTLADSPISVTLESVPEARALETLLRSATGYVAAPRRAGAPGASRFDRILILMSRSPPAPSAISPTVMPASPNAPPMLGVTPGQFGSAPPSVPPLFPQTPTFNPAPQLPGAPGNPLLEPTAPRPGIILAPPANPPGASP